MQNLLIDVTSIFQITLYITCYKRPHFMGARQLTKKFLKEANQSHKRWKAKYIFILTADFDLIFVSLSAKNCATLAVF